MFKNKISLEMTEQQVGRLVDQMPTDAKIRLARKLNRETGDQRFDDLLKKIDQRRKKHRITPQEIRREVKAVRKKIYDKGRR